MNCSLLFRKGFDAVLRDAVISNDLFYRYELRRWWNDAMPFCLFWMLNPSTADAAIDDRTIRRCVWFANREGCGGLIVVNWFAWRSAYPSELQQEPHPVGLENYHYIRRAISLCKGPLIAAWGGNKMVKPYLNKLPNLLGNRKLMCFGTNDDGSPKHPLYLPKTSSLVLFEMFQ
jgi:hypothetical protein